MDKGRLDRHHPVSRMLCACYLGAALSILLQVSGYIMLAIGIVLTILVHVVIDPKLKAISNEYETKQKTYLQELEAKVRWQTTKKNSS